MCVCVCGVCVCVFDGLCIAQLMLTDGGIHFLLIKNVSKPEFYEIFDCFHTN